jgi:sugar phosphate isomerase/epimerase
MFRLGAMTDEISQDFEHAVAVCKEYGLQTAEIRSVWNKPPQDLTDTDIKAMKAILEEAGMTVSCIASPFYKCDLDDAEARGQHLEILRRCIALAQAMGATLVRGFAFWKVPDLDAAWGQIIEAFGEPIQIVSEAGIILAIENEASTSMATAALVERFLRETDHPNIKAIWDPANEVFADDGERPYPEAFERVKPWMVHFHLKDALRDEEGKPRCVPIGEGSIDYPGQLAALLASDYDGAVSLETHWRPVELSEEQLARPGGSAFSESGEYASRVCLDNLLRIMRRITG